MDEKTTVAELKRRVQGFCEARDWDPFHGGKDLAIGIITEAAELLELFRFRSESEVAEIIADSERVRKVQDELADVLFFVLRMAQRAGFDLTACLFRKMEESARKYPVDTSRGSNRKYNER